MAAVNRTWGAAARQGSPAMMNGTYMVNKASVVCGNVQTANATVYIIDTVLMPPAH